LTGFSARGARSAVAAAATVPARPWNDDVGTGIRQRGGAKHDGKGRAALGAAGSAESATTTGAAAATGLTFIVGVTRIFIYCGEASGTAAPAPAAW
jgi:hypothetical protein